MHRRQSGGTGDSNHRWMVLREVSGFEARHVLVVDDCIHGDQTPDEKDRPIGCAATGRDSGQHSRRSDSHEAPDVRTDGMSQVRMRSTEPHRLRRHAFPADRAGAAAQATAASGAPWARMAAQAAGAYWPALGAETVRRSKTRHPNFIDLFDI